MATLQEQIANARERLRQAEADKIRSGGIDLGRGGYYTSAQNDLARLQNELESTSNAQAAAEYQLGPYQQAVANQQQILDNSNQRLNEVRSDPMDQIFQDAVKRQLDTKALESALFSQGSDMSTAADNNRQQRTRDQIMQRGGNLNDPSAQAALAASVSQRQDDQQRNAREATLAGYAQGQAGIGAGLAYSQNRNNQLNTATGMANQALSMPVMTKPSVNMVGVTGEQANQAYSAAQQNTRPTGAGFAPRQAAKKSGQMPSYSDFLQSQNKG